MLAAVKEPEFLAGVLKTWEEYERQLDKLVFAATDAQLERICDHRLSKENQIAAFTNAGIPDEIASRLVKKIVVEIAYRMSRNKKE